MTVWRVHGGEWGWASADPDLEVIGICPMRYYVQRQKETIAEYIAGRPIYKICTWE